MGSSRPPTSNTVDQPTTLRELYKQIDWLNALLIVGIPLYGCVQAFWVPLRPATAAFAVAYYFLTGLGITAGYHRLWSHRSYSATTPLRITLALFGAGAAEGSIRWWARGHRAHHRYTDTAQDPYSVRKGLLYAHIGWMLMKPDPKQRRGQADVSDLNDDPIVVWQHRHYLKLVLFMALIFPALVCSLCWADWSGGLIYAGILRTFFLQQATFCVNSLAHWFGEQPFDNRRSPRDHFFTALVTFGEGYHNFHHEFPSDFRNAIEWYQYDLTKWAIWLCARAGLAYDLKRFRMNEIEKGRVQQLQKRLDHRAGRLQQEGDEDGDHHLFADLPVMSWDEYQARVREQGEMLVVVAGFVHDVTSFIARHPGGEAMMRSSIGRDATALFNGGIYNHSKKARDILATLRVGVLRGGGEVEIWKKTLS